MLIVRKMRERSHGGVKLFICGILLSLNRTSLSSYCGPNVQDLIHDIQLNPGHEWTQGFLTSKDIYSKSSCGKVIIYRFNPPGKMKHSFSITFIFHEYYHNLQVSRYHKECTSSRKLPSVVLNVLSLSSIVLSPQR